MNTEDMFHRTNGIRKIEDLRKYIKELRIFASNNKSEKTVIELIEETIDKAKAIDDKKSLVDLLELKISQIEHLYDSINQISEMMMLMRNLSLEINYSDGLALSYNIEWFIEKMRGNKPKSKKALDFSIKILSNCKEYDEYSYFVCYYSYAVELWLEEKNPQSSSILEKCVDYFSRNGFYRSLAQSIGLLSVIYLRTQNIKKGLVLLKNLFSNKQIFQELPYDVKGVVCYFAGLAHMLNTNLYYAELYFNESYNILKSVIDKSIYSSNFIILHSFLSMVMALQGKIELASEMILEENISKQEHIRKNLDVNTENQIIHTRNLTKFYVMSRLGNYHPDNYQELIERIYHGLENCYSNYIALSEYILNANLDITKLKLLLDIENFSVKRVKHIIEFKIEQEKTDFKNSEEKSINCIRILEKRIKAEKTTFIENAYSDLLIAQQLFLANRLTEIYPLLKKYEKQLNRIEILEMRIYMEAFIQVGKFKNGDPLAPALHFMAIKRCRESKFSRLEVILLEQQETLRKIALNALKY